MLGLLRTRLYRPGERPRVGHLGFFGFMPLGRGNSAKPILCHVAKRVEGFGIRWGWLEGMLPLGQSSYSVVCQAEDT